jgi:O-antigen/teichoic acid export membrane protein
MRFPISVLIARFLGPEGKGLLYLLFASLTLSAVVGSLGLGAAAVYCIGKDRKCLSAALGNFLVVTGGVWVLFGIGGWLFLQYGRQDVYAQFPLWIWAAVACLMPILLCENYLVDVLSAVLRIKAINIVEVARSTTHLLLVVVLVAVMRKGLAGAFLANALADFFATTSLFLLVLRYGGRPKKPDFALLGTSLRFGVKSYLSNFIRLVDLRLNVFLLTGLAVNGLKAAGVYSVASGLAELLLFIPFSIRRGLFPMIVTSSTETADRLTSTACRHTVFLTTIAALGFAALGPFVIRQLYGKDFAGALMPLLILLPGVLLLSQAQILYGDLAGRGKPGVSSISVILSLIVMVILDIILIPHYGVNGAALASTCAYAVELVVAGAFFLSHTSLRWKEVFLFRRSDLRYYVDFFAKRPAAGSHVTNP